jgi:outer membrane cobalamin receptor
MIRNVSIALLCLVAPCIVASMGTAQGASVHGQVTDSSGAVIPGAHVGLFNRLGLVDERVTDKAGEFNFTNFTNEIDDEKLIVTASGFATKTVDSLSNNLQITMDLAPVEDSIRVAGSTIDVPASEQASSVSVITGDEIRERNEEQASDLMRDLPGVVISQSGGRGGATSAYIRGGEYSYALVTIDGVPVNSFAFGGGFDFSQVPTDLLERIEVVRGAQSAVYGSYANSGVVNFVTRSAANHGDALDVIADGGSHGERRFAVSGSGTLAGFGIAGTASRIDIDSDGNVPNSDWRNESVLLHVNRNWEHQSFSATGNFDSSEVGVPGPYGSDPVGLYAGVDTVSRDKNNVSDYAMHYQADLTSRVRGEIFGGFSLGNDFYASPYGNSFNKDIRGQAEARAVISVAKYWTMSTGFVWAREEVENTYVTNTASAIFPLRRDEQGIYWENRFQFGGLYMQAGVRGDIFETPFLPNGSQWLPANTYGKIDPKLAVGYRLPNGTRLHASIGTGIRPPGGYDLAFTTNPDLKPERTLSVDAGVSQSFASGKIVLDASYFYSRYYDLIVTLGGSLTNLSSFTSANLSNAKVQGVEFSAQYRPARWLAFVGNYNYLDTKVLALNGSDGLAAQYFTVGQQLARRPSQSGSFRLVMSKGRVAGDINGYVRGQDLDVEPNYGASEGFFRSPGYANLSLNLNIKLGGGVTAFGTVRNLLNERYEEIFGFPSPKLTFISGLKWSFRGKD